MSNMKLSKSLLLALTIVLVGHAVSYSGVAKTKSEQTVSCDKRSVCVDVTTQFNATDVAIIVHSSPCDGTFVASTPILSEVIVSDELSTFTLDVPCRQIEPPNSVCSRYTISHDNYLGCNYNVRYADCASRFSYGLV